MVTKRLDSDYIDTEGHEYLDEGNSVYTEFVDIPPSTSQGFDPAEGHSPKASLERSEAWT